MRTFVMRDNRMFDRYDELVRLNSRMTYVLWQLARFRYYGYRVI
jgi:hypothetical protein